MKLARFTKASGERKRYSVEYADWLDTGETLSGVSFSVLPVTDTPLVVDASAIAPSGTQVVFYVNAGLTGTTYTTEITATTSGGQVKVDQILYSIRET